MFITREPPRPGRRNVQLTLRR